MKKIFTFPHFVHVPLPTLFLLFASGFAMLVVQIMGTRVLGPFVGTALPVWASLIGTTLIGGAIGYYAGGTLADTRQSTKMSFMIASLAAVSIVLIPLFRDTVLNLLGTLTYMQVTLLSAIILFLPPALFLSMLVTYAIRIHVIDCAGSRRFVCGCNTREYRWGFCDELLSHSDVHGTAHTLWCWYFCILPRVSQFVDNSSCTRKIALVINGVFKGRFTILSVREYRITENRLKEV
jgi:hypothetical protein